MWFLVGLISLPILMCIVGIIFVKTSAHGFSAHAQPTMLETFAANQARNMAMPSDAKNTKSPVANFSEVLAEARAHWPDHCATCHGNDGRGKVEMGQNMYPPAPDMTQKGTQSMTDGEIFYTIENGIRLSGMPAWGNGSEEGRRASWKLVYFIRHLPNLSPGEVKEMEKLNPKTPEELQEEQEEEHF
jgi:mono/diheme cytochrome c family protein